MIIALLFWIVPTLLQGQQNDTTCCFDFLNTDSSFEPCDSLFLDDTTHSSDRAFLYRGSSKKINTSNWDWRLWGMPYGNWTNNAASSPDIKFDAHLFGIMAGFEKKYDNRLSYGLGAGGSWLSVGRNRYHKDIDTFKLQAIAKWEQEDWLIKFGTGFGYQSQQHERNSHVGFFGEKNKANQFGIQSEFQLKMGSELFRIEPYVALDYFDFTEKAYQERLFSGTGTGVYYPKDDLESIRSALGFRYRWRQTGNLVVWYPEVNAAWAHEFGSDRVFRSSCIDPFPTLYTFPNSSLSKDHLIFGLKMTGQLGRSMEIFAHYNADVAKDCYSHTIMCGTYWNF